MPNRIDADPINEQDHGQTFWRSATCVDSVLPDLPDGTDLDDAEFRCLADNLPTLCWIARGDGFIVWYNRRFHEYTGVDRDSLRGWGWSKVHHPEQVTSVTQRWVECIASGEPFEMVFPLKGADGRFRSFLTRITPMRDASGEIVRWFGVNTEIGAQIRAEAALSSSEARYTVLTEAMPQMVWSTLPDGFHDYYNDQWYRFTGMPYGSTDGEAWNGVFHPDDQDRAWDIWRQSLTTGDVYEIEYRLRHHNGEYRWVLGRALPVRNEADDIIRWIGTCTDIHDAKVAAEQNEILSRELSHRIKNIFAVISGLIGLSARDEPEAKGFAARLVDRIMALGRAHEFARPHSDESRPAFEQTTLATMLADLMQPYQLPGHQRVVIGGDDLEVDDQAATPVALVFHELATNAAKYGALSLSDGQVVLTISKDAEDVLVRWQELGGPPVEGPPTRTGFGSRLAELSVRQQLGGEIDRQWDREGLVVTIRLQADRLLRRRMAHA